MSDGYPSQASQDMADMGATQIECNMSDDEEEEEEEDADGDAAAPEPEVPIWATLVRGTGERIELRARDAGDPGEPAALKSGPKTPGSFNRYSLGRANCDLLVEEKLVSGTHCHIYCVYEHDQLSDGAASGAPSPAGADSALSPAADSAPSPMPVTPGGGAGGSGGSVVV